MDRVDRVLARIDAEEESLVRMMQDLIRIDTVNPPGNESRVALYIEPILKDLGFTVELVEATKGRANVIATLVGKVRKSRLCFFSHTDTVPVGDPAAWIVDPFGGIVRDGKIYGRGASDHKFPMAALTTAIKAIQDAGIKLDGDLVYAFTADEESGSRAGMRFLTSKGMVQGDYGVYVVASSASDEGRSLVPWYGEHNIIVASNGLLTYEVAVRGKTSHTAFLEMGINAIYKAAKLVVGFEQLAEQVNSRTDPDTGRSRMSVNMMQGGEGETQVPCRCEIVIHRAITPSESADQATKEIQNVIDAAIEKDPDLAVELELTEGMPAISLSRDSALVRIIKKCALRVTGKEPACVGLPAGMDMAWFGVRTGVPTAAFGYGDLFGSHAPNEFITIPDVVNTSKACALIILEILAGAE